MYDKSLEKLIDAVIADGVITDQERKVVYKKASSLGIDQDEIEVYLEGRLMKAMKGSSSKSNKHGITKVCPNCGAYIRSFEVKCSECGHEFHNIGSVQSMENFFKKLSSTSDNKEKCELIKTFPIPNDKESLLEFLALSTPNSKDAIGIFDKGPGRLLMLFYGVIIILALTFLLGISVDDFDAGLSCLVKFGLPASGVLILIALIVGKNNSQARAWEIKTQAALNKTKIIGLNDPEFQTKANVITSEFYRAKKNRTIIMSICGILTLGLVCFLLFPGPSFNDMHNLIQKGDYIEAELLLNKVNKRANYEEQNINLKKYLVLCVTNMCEKKEYGDAKRFVNKYRRDLGVNTIEELNVIIWKYEHPGEEYQPELSEESKDDE